MKKAVKERAVIQEKVPKLFVNGKDTMTVCNIDELEGLVLVYKCGQERLNSLYY